ncbi:MAG: cupin domain-containing protein [Ignavibacteriae bacterium]|nr:MAG: cupin domain-containing protein [Ignavibacteriota bacterium]
MELKVQNINEIINYQEDSVVSKVLLKKDTGNVTLFAFDENQGLSEHTTPFDAMVQIVDGEAEITIGGEPHTVKKDEFIIMPANVPHALKAIKKYKMILTMIKA